MRTGYVIGISDRTEYDRTKMKTIDSVCTEGIAAPGRLVALPDGSRRITARR